MRLQAGPLIDRNGNLVPDGTEVTFESAYEAGNQYLPALVGRDNRPGWPRCRFTLRQPGTVVFSARSGDCGARSGSTSAAGAPADAHGLAVGHAQQHAGAQR